MTPGIPPNNSSATATMDGPRQARESSLVTSTYWDINSDDPTDACSTLDDDNEPFSKLERLYGRYNNSLPIPFQSEAKPYPPPNKDENISLWDLPIDYRDVSTPDDWIPRDGRLIRLTGKHPMNACMPMNDELDFLTPQHVHFVRNHGVTPKCTWDTHCLVVAGTKMTLNQLIVQRPQREFPVTLVSAALRRNELNHIKSTLGVGWGIGGIGTSVYKGVLAKAILEQAGVTLTSSNNRWVEFVGSEDLINPVGPGPYKTWNKIVRYTKYLPLSYVWNIANDVIVAYMANGQPLLPDHGYPIRLVVPGCIAGYSVKWLTEINVVDQPDGPFYFHEHRLFSPSTTSTTDYTHEHAHRLVNLNSVMTSPGHLESWLIVPNLYKNVELSGYAIGGGGVPITRVEVSWDGGDNWQLAKLRRAEQPTVHGKSWCHVGWSLEVPVVDVVRAQELWCRAWDAAFHIQPTLPTWNILGVAANHVYKIRVTKDQFHVRFQHPSGVAGWMNSIANRPYSAGFGPLVDMEPDEDYQDAHEMSIESKPHYAVASQRYTMAQVEQHNSFDDLWIVVNNRIFDCTKYLEYHPGGIESITINGGQDATFDFMAIHSKRALKMLSRYFVGDLMEEGNDEVSVVSNSSSASMSSDPGEHLDDRGSPIALYPRRRVAFKLQRKIILSGDSILLDFALPTPNHILGLPTGKHIMISAEIGGNTVNRRYTPISSNHDLGRVQFVVKIYRPTPVYPRGGKMSQYLSNLCEGDMLDMRGPVGPFEYIGQGRYTIEGHAGYCQKMNMIAGGSGISPIMQIAAHVLRDLEDNTQMTLIYACRQESDIMLRSALDQWHTMFPDKFRVHYILSDSWPRTWQYSTGFINKELMEQHLFRARDDVLNVMCGPPVMLEKGCTPNLVKLGHHEDKIHSF
jgi:nitrate reductase (NAD(P)H)